MGGVRAVWTAWTVLGVVLAAPGTPGAEIVGLWATEPTDKGHARVRIIASDGTFDGTLVWLSEPDFPASEPSEFAGRPKTDRRNPDPALRARPLLGLRILHGLSRRGDSTFEGGTIYDPETGRTYRCRARLAADGTLRLRGFLGVSWLGRTTTWTRVDEPVDDGRDAAR